MNTNRQNRAGMNKTGLDTWIRFGKRSELLFVTDISMILYTGIPTSAGQSCVGNVTAIGTIHIELSVGSN